MDKLIKTFLVCYITDLALFYMPYVFFYGVFGESISMLFGIWGMDMGLFFTHGYFFILLIVVIYIFILSQVRNLEWKRIVFESLLLIVLSYPVFIFLSIAFAGLNFAMQDSEFDLAQYKDYKKIFLEASLIGLLMILFSPITYLMMLSHWVVTQLCFRRSGNLS